MIPSLASWYTGALIAAACGDALGGAVEFISRSEIASRYPDGLRDIVGGGWLNLVLGKTTDDTAMMLAIARACTPEGTYIEAVAAHLVTWMQTGPKDIGNQTSQALTRLARGMR